MPSRKRIKGKERKAKAAAAQVVVKGRSWELWARWGARKEGVRCNHGCLTIPQPGHPVSNFMVGLEEVLQDMPSFVPYMEDTYGKHPEVWENAELRMLARDILVSLSTNFVLYLDQTVRAKALAVVINLLEQYDGTGNTIMSGAAATRDTIGGEERDAIRFYSKRNACECLKEKYKEAKKSQPKVGRCAHCDQQRERSSLMLCGRCKLYQYCSRGCQAAAWEEHREECALYRSLQENSSNCASAL